MIYFRHFLLLLVVVVCFATAPSIGADNRVFQDYLGSSVGRDRLPEVYLLGTHLCRYPQPDREELLRDLGLLKRKGFNLIKIQTHWAVDERSEGVYDFSAYEFLISEAERLGLGVYIGMTCEQAPMWLYRKFPDCRMVGRNGVPVQYEATYTMPADGKPGPCFLHEGAKELQDRYIRALVNALGKFRNVIVWNTWQETANYSNWSLGGQSIDYSPASLSAFDKYLKNKYETLDKLNRAWSTTFGEWSQVGPNRDRDLGLPQDVDWKYFMEDVYPSLVLEGRYEVIKQQDPLHRPVFAHLSYPVIGSAQNFIHGRCQDFLGTSHYPAWGSYHGWDDRTKVPQLQRTENLRFEQMGGIALNTDYLRSSLSRASPVWAAEMQAGPVAVDFHKGRVPDQADIRRWMLGSVAGGSTSIVFWVTRSEIMASENNGFSLLDGEGDSTPRFEEAARVGEALSTYPDLFAAPTLEPANVGILVDEENYQFCNSLANLKEHLAYDVRGWYGFLWQLGFPVDFVSIRQLESQGGVSHSCLVLPFSPALGSRSIDALRSFVTNGGHLICEAAPGRIDERGLSVRGEIPKAFRTLFGVDQKSFQMVSEPKGDVRWMPPARTWGEFLPETNLTCDEGGSDEGFPANLYLQTFGLQGGKPILWAGGQPAGVVCQVGKGSATLLGTYLGHGAFAHRSEASWRFVDRLLRERGGLSHRDGNLVWRKRISGNSEAWIFANLGDSSVSSEIDFGTVVKVTPLLGLSLKGDGSTRTLSLDPMDYGVVVVQR